MKTYQEELEMLIKQAYKQGRYLMAIYYQQRLGNSACVDWDTFRKSWAAEAWIKKNQSQADTMAQRRAYLGIKQRND